MSHLYQTISLLRKQWSNDSYSCEEYPAISEILEYQIEPETKTPRFLRIPQVTALETYWYLRLMEKTPHIFDLYKNHFSKKTDLIQSLGISKKAFETVDYEFDDLIDRIKNDENFVKDFKLESIRETLTLEYPSYILALAMGAGKTILIGSIIATEFVMALEYPEGPFVQNALVFAPGKTIIESLRELSEIPYEKILPPRFYKQFAASLKLTFTRDGEKNIPVIRGSSFNVVVTNTEKIRIQKESIRKSEIGDLFAPEREDEARAEIANLRLQDIASLPHLAVFSDEAHHTYGQSMGKELKKVRKTVDYLYQKSPNLICVINTTGTPYFERQPLKDVVVWYGLSEGIAGGILKDVADNIRAYSFSNENAPQFLGEVVKNFFKDYADVCLPNGAPAKIAVYFPQNEDLSQLRPVVESTLIEIGQSPSIVLRNTSESTKDEIDAFNRLNVPESLHRVILLVNKGTEGWNCPSLFACALARKLKSSNNFVLQAATRCLRQVPGNSVSARIYLSMDNRSVLDRQLQETYGETISDLLNAGRERGTALLKLRKFNMPPLVFTQTVRTVARRDNTLETTLSLEKPSLKKSGLTEVFFTLSKQQATKSVLQQVGDSVHLDTIEKFTDTYTAAVELSQNYRLNLWLIYDELMRLYGKKGEIPNAHLPALCRQIEEQTRFYEIKEEKIDFALALVKPEGFTKEKEQDGTEVYTAEITYFKDREKLLLNVEDIHDNQNNLGFHYAPYNFDSTPEKSFFEQMLKRLNLHPSEIEDIYFTGALTDRNKTDFFVEYRDDKGKWRKYTPDFIIRKKAKGKKQGKCYIVEIKADRYRDDKLDGENGRKAMALRKLEKINPELLKYEIIYTGTDTISYDQTKGVREFVEKIQE